jgi:5'-nucleotidase/UDP-sugar diphosphatase
MESLARMSYDALVIGEGEVTAGLDMIDSLLDAHGLKGISNNILDKKTGKPRYEPYTIVKAGRLKVGVTGMISSSASLARRMEHEQSEHSQEEIEFARGIERSRETLKMLRKKKVDVAILAAHQVPGSLHALADSLPGYDVILTGARRRADREPERHGDAVLAGTAGGCSYLGELVLTVRGRKVRDFQGSSFELGQDDGPVDEYLKTLTYEILELDEKGERLPKRSSGEQRAER